MRAQTPTKLSAIRDLVNRGETVNPSLLRTFDINFVAQLVSVAVRRRNLRFIAQVEKVRGAVRDQRKRAEKSLSPKSKSRRHSASRINHSGDAIADKYFAQRAKFGGKSALTIAAGYHQ